MSDWDEDYEDVSWVEIRNGLLVALAIAVSFCGGMGLLWWVNGS